MCGRNATGFKATFFRHEWFEKFTEVIDSIEEVTLMGWGEPTIHPDFVDFLRTAHEHGLRKYICTNGMKLGELEDAIFEYGIDIVAVSLDGASEKANARIRTGADFHKITSALSSIVSRRERYPDRLPYMNFVFTAMRSNIRELPLMVDLAANIGLDEIKVVFLTVFMESLLHESLFNDISLVRDVFGLAHDKAQSAGISLKLPNIPGEDPAKDMPHKECYTAWRDFFLGSDGYVRACMSSPAKLFHIEKYNDFASMWNSLEYTEWRGKVNRASMDEGCKRCYQSSYANWNNEHAHIQIGNEFSPEWDA